MLTQKYPKFTSKLPTNVCMKLQNHDGKNPLFLTVGYMNPHDPLQTLPEDLARVPETVNNEVWALLYTMFRLVLTFWISIYMYLSTKIRND